ncbi:MAG: hypothetical protein PHX38_09510 [Sulfuricella sp.]|nr:hypothetical protein [Sulfuricella sp.]
MKTIFLAFLLAAPMLGHAAQGICPPGFDEAIVQPGAYGAVNERAYRLMFTPFDQYDKIALEQLLAGGAAVALQPHSRVCVEAGDNFFLRAKVHIPGKTAMYWVRETDIAK